MTESGRKGVMSGRDRECRPGQMGRCMKVLSWLIRDTGKGALSILIRLPISVVGSMILLKGMASLTQSHKTTLTRENGTWTLCTAKEPIQIKKAFMKASLKSPKEMVRVNSHMR